MAMQVGRLARTYEIALCWNSADIWTRPRSDTDCRVVHWTETTLGLLL